MSNDLFLPDAPWIRYADNNGRPYDSPYDDEDDYEEDDFDDEYEDEELAYYGDGTVLKDLYNGGKAPTEELRAGMAFAPYRL